MSKKANKANTANPVAAVDNVVESTETDVTEQVVEAQKEAILLNKHTAPLGLPNGITIDAGKSVKIDDWSTVSGHHVVRSWLKAGVLEVQE